MLILGHNEPSDMVSGICGDSSVQGQPLTAAVGGGSSFSLGHRISSFSFLRYPAGLPISMAIELIFEATQKQGFYNNRARCLARKWVLTLC